MQLTSEISPGTSCILVQVEKRDWEVGEVHRQTRNENGMRLQYKSQKYSMYKASRPEGLQKLQK